MWKALFYCLFASLVRDTPANFGSLLEQWLSPWKYLPTKKNLQQAFAYLRLLFSSDPSILDVFLIIGGVVFAIAAGIPFPLLGILFGQLVNDLNSSTCDPTQNNIEAFQSSVRTKVLYIIYITIANFGFIYLHAGCWSLVGERLVRRLRKRYFQSLLKQEASFFDTLPPGDVVSRLVTDIEVVQSGTSEKVGIYISTISYFVASYVVAFTKVAAIAGMLVSVVPCYFLMAFVGGHYIQKYASRIAEHANAATSVASSSLSHLPLVHAFNANQRLEAIFSRHLSLARMDALKKALTHAIQLGLLYFIAYSSNALAFWQGSRMIADRVAHNASGVSVGAVYTVIFVLLDASFILSQVAPFIHIFSAATDASDRLRKIIERPSAIDGTSSRGDRSVKFEADDIEFRDVFFSYPSRPEAPVLQGVNFKIPPNKHTAIVGASGGGKSTIVALLERFYDPTGGDIIIGDRNFKDINVQHLRGNIGYVPQEPNLLDRSILENIAHGLVSSAAEKHRHLAPVLLDASLPDLVNKIRRGIPESEAVASCDPRVSEILRLVRDAAATANALSFIEALPQGFATSVGAAGNQLSGGQKQRIALARALVREPRILLLDEATAALDSTSEQLIQSALKSIAEKITIVSIAHRLATAKDAHNIVVVQKGRVVEQGTHSELIARDGVYAGMVKLQSLQKISIPDLAMEDSISCSSVDKGHAQVRSSDKDTTSDASDEKPAANEEIQPKGTIEKSTEDNKKNKPKKRSLWSTLKHTFPLIRPNMGFIFLGIASAAVVGGSYSGEAILFGHTVGSLRPCKGVSSIRHSGHLYGLLFFILALIEFTAVVVSGSAFGWAADKILYRVRVLSLRSLLRKSLKWHNSEGRKPGTLVSHITSDAAALSGLTGSTIGLLFSTAVNLIAGIAISHAIAWKISIVLLATVPVLLSAGMMKLRVQAQFAERHQKAFAEATAITVEAVDGIKTVAAFSLENEVYQVYSRSLQGPYQATLRAIAWGNLWLSLSFSISNLVYALAYWWGSRQIASGMYSQTQFFIVLPALLFSAQSCGQMFALAPDVSKARVAATNIVNLLTDRSEDEEPGKVVGPGENDVLHEKVQDIEAYPQGHKAEQEACSGRGGIGVELRDVHFAYASRQDRPVLRGLSLQIPAGQFCALVGPSGSGKSTTFAMLERFYRPSSGSVIIDGVDVVAQAGTSFRDDIALVPQENVLFEGTVAFNIALGARPDHEPTQAEIEEACRLANIHDTIMALPQGYETMCSQDGKQFSGGQRQRLSIARALVRKPRLLLLDESTSALDVESEKRIQEALATVAKQTTIVAIAHRLNTIYRADRIFLIEEGRCVDQGTHAELVERSETYRKSVIHQSLE
ncbi:ABC transporter [Rasamsonia emersonii CBS 393.64]|uniref:ABC transporter n=1 Tax=Rasamsonia emersonii (strain ATCC 16479 / CBS 393.64 / IMI 116815) TaxID=1408163 RepID=A0A0F4Z0B3_RASE3|nr:ABC transporter [Rasamsonia emersonii CBS 393.64]KKA23303.1 ABC transporter [Rasamsonia emersonii CBS 393.64]